MQTGLRLFGKKISILGGAGKTHCSHFLHLLITPFLISSCLDFSFCILRREFGLEFDEKWRILQNLLPAYGVQSISHLF